MATSKVIATTSAGVTAQTASLLLDLPNELFDEIMEHVFIFPSPIEFSPIEDSLHTMNVQNLGESQYQHVLNFQTRIRPNLRTLRACKKFCAHGVAAYYGKNKFRFSSPFGGLVLARFFNLIGSGNMHKLRNVTIAHSSLWQTPTNWSHFYVRRLSPFGMADNPGFREVYHHVHGRMQPQQDPLEVLQRIRLKSLTFLIYSLDTGFAESRRSQQEFFGFETPNILGHKVNAMDWKSVAGLKVRVCNLWYNDCDSGPVRLREVDAAFSDPTSWPGYPFTDEARPSARNITQQLRAQNWGFDDAALGKRSGVWPSNVLANGSIEDVEWCEDPGFVAREYLEHAWIENSYSPCSSGVWYDGCIKCWKYQRDECSCENGGTFLSYGWTGPEIFIANPGVPITIDPSVSNDKTGDATWVKSQAVKDMDDCDQREWDAVFECWFP